MHGRTKCKVRTMACRYVLRLENDPSLSLYAIVTQVAVSEHGR